MSQYDVPQYDDDCSSPMRTGLLQGDNIDDVCMVYVYKDIVVDPARNKVLAWPSWKWKAFGQISEFVDESFQQNADGALISSSRRLKLVPVNTTRRNCISNPGPSSVQAGARVRACSSA